MAHLQSDSGCGKYFRSIRRCPFTLSKGCSLNTSFIPLFCANDHKAGGTSLYTSSLRHPRRLIGFGEKHQPLSPWFASTLSPVPGRSAVPGRPASLCGVSADKVMLGGQGLPTGLGPVKGLTQTSANWLVFFTEPYEAAGWRSDEVYSNLLPELCSLAQSSGMKLVFKLHPFESLKGHRRMLRKYLPQQESEIMVIAGRAIGAVVG